MDPSAAVATPIKTSFPHRPECNAPQQMLPIMVFTILLRKHLLRGITFGAVRK